MRTTVNIARAVWVYNRRKSPNMLPSIVGLTMGLLAGCSVSATTSISVKMSDLEGATREAVRPIGRARVSFDRPLPEHLIQRLCDEYTLVLITDEQDWQSFEKRVGIDGKSVDLSRGAIVGILADVGESANDSWPIRLRSSRVVQGAGWIEAQFASGVYYPLKTAGYLDLAYVPGLRSVRRVCIYPGPRSFIIGSAEPVE